MILSIETATAVCGVALVHDGVVLAQLQEEGKHIHAERLLSLVDGVLAGREAETLEAIAVSIGPGSFTGLRIGLSCGKGIAFALDRPMVAVPTLEAIALKAVRAGQAKEGDVIVPVLDARRGEVYCQYFRATREGVTADDSPKDVAVDDLLRSLSAGRAILTGEAVPRLRGAGTEGGQALRFIDPPTSSCDAGVVGIIGERLFREGRTDDPGSLEPRYIKDFFLRAPATTQR